MFLDTNKKKFFNSGKLHDHLSFTLDDIDFSSFLSKNKNSNQLIYELTSIVIHFGDSKRGHYTAISKIENKWFIFDDVKVIEIPPEKVLEKQAFLLFYTRKSHSLLANIELISKWNEAIPIKIFSDTNYWKSSVPILDFLKQYSLSPFLCNQPLVDLIFNQLQIQIFRPAIDEDFLQYFICNYSKIKQTYLISKNSFENLWNFIEKNGTKPIINENDEENIEEKFLISGVIEIFFQSNFEQK